MNREWPVQRSPEPQAANDKPKQNRSKPQRPSRTAFLNYTTYLVWSQDIRHTGSSGPTPFIRIQEGGVQTSRRIGHVFCLLLSLSLGWLVPQGLSCRDDEHGN